MKLEPPQSGVRQTGVSISEYVLGKSWPHRGASNYICLLGAWSYAYVVLFILFFKPSCNGPETELKRKIGIRENIPLVFYHIKTVGA